MKQQLSTILKGILIMALSVFCMLPASAQRDRKEISLLDKDQIRRITDIVKPLKTQVEKKVINDDRYKSYLEDLKAVDAATNPKDKNSLTDKIKEKYSPYFNELWTGLRVDVKGYQEKIRQVFPPNIGSLIEFDIFLNFTVLVSTTTLKPVEPPPTPPERENICVDVCSIAAGEIKGDAVLIASGGGTYGNCFLRTNSWGTGAFLGAWSELNGWLRNNITIPGTFPDDARKLRVKTSYEIRLEATAFAALGSGSAETSINTPKTSEALVVIAPIIWGMHKVTMKTINENYLIAKKDVATSRFWSFSNTFSFLGSGTWSSSDASGIKWTICEEK